MTGAELQAVFKNAEQGQLPGSNMGGNERRYNLTAEQHKQQLQLRYKGDSLKKRVVDNINNYDHNILGLANRKQASTQNEVQDRVKQAPPLYKSVDTQEYRTQSRDRVSHTLQGLGKGEAEAGVKRESPRGSS